MYSIPNPVLDTKYKGKECGLGKSKGHFMKETMLKWSLGQRRVVGLGMKDICLAAENVVG